MSETINTFISGINRDLDKSLLKQTMAYNIENFRLVSKSGTSTGALENVKGNALSVEIPDISTMYFITLDSSLTVYNPNITVAINGNAHVYFKNPGDGILEFYNWLVTTFGALSIVITLADDTIVIYSLTGSLTLYLVSPVFPYTEIAAVSDLKVIGYANIRETTVLFTTNYSGTSEASIKANGWGQLWKLTYDDAYATPVPTIELLYNGLLAFSDYHPIEAIGRFETEDVRKVYWVDNFNYFRSCNIDQDDLLTLEPNQFDVVPDSTMDTPKLVGLSNDGLYEAGVVQYSYQLYNDFGAQTSFSPCSNLVHLTKSDEWTSDTRTYLGSPIDEQTGKSVNMVIENIDTRFSNIRVVSIYWTTLNSLPIVSYVLDQPLSNQTSISFKDTGLSIAGTITADEFVISGGSLVIPKTLTTKNDYMFLGNIREPNWDVDFDARAFRYDLFGNCNVADAAGNLLAVDPSNLPPETHDCIAPFNSDRTSSFKYAYGATYFGGTGPNVSYRFGLEAVNGDTNATTDYQFYVNNTKEDHTINTRVYPNDSFNNESSPQVDGLIRGYQRDEIYRFGIVFFNKKQQASFVHWIGDIRMPHLTDIDSYTTGLTNENCYNIADGFTAGSAVECKLYQLYIDFTVDLSNITATERADITGFSIVRADRTGNDKTVIANGMLTPISNTTLDPDGADNPWPMHSIPVNYYATKDFFNFTAPEIAFNKNLTFKSGDYVDVCGIHGFTTIDSTLGAGHYEYTARQIDLIPYGPTQFTSPGIADAKIVGLGYGTLYTIGSNTYRNYYYNPATEHAYHGTSMPIKLNGSGGPTLAVAYDYRGLSVNYKRNTIQYGGPSYIQRSNTEYIECSYVPVSESIDLYSTQTFGGDTFVCFFDYLKFSWDEGESPNTFLEPCGFPVESSINTWLRHDRCWSKDMQRYELQESRALGVAQFGALYPAEATDLYLYNTVYSQQNTLKTFYPEPINFPSNELHDVTMMVSQKKFNGERIDNWLKFLTDDRKEVDANYGPINKLLNWKNYIYFWQDKAFGIQSVQVRSLVSDTNAAPLVLGTGDVLDRHDYVSTEIGSRHQWGVVNSKDSIAWYDANTRKVYRYGDNVSPISDVKGLNTYFANNYYGRIIELDNPFHTILATGAVGVNGVYDDRYNEYVFSFSNIIYPVSGPVYTSATIAFNDTIDAFTAFYSFDPSIYIKTWNKLITQPKNDPGKLYLHDFGNYGEFYGVLNDSKVEYYTTDNYPYSKVFDAIEYITEVTYNGADLLKETFNQIRCYNTNQNSDWYNIHYYDGTAIASNEIDSTRRESNWNISLPRNAVLLSLPNDPDIFNAANLDQTRPFRERLRDNYLFTSLVYHNANSTGTAKNYRMVFPYIKTIYRVSQR